MKKRETGIDFLRCLALFFVNAVHAMEYIGFYEEPQAGLLMLPINSFRWLFYCCVGLFLMITGYLKSTKKPDKKWLWDLVPILVSYVLTCVISFPIRHFLLQDPLPLKDWIIKFLSFGNYGWYVEMYIGLMLLAPFINLALDQLKSTKQLLMAAGMLVVLTALPSVTPYPLAPDAWTDCYPLTYYMIGAVIRRLQPKIPLWKSLGCAAVIMLCMGLASLMLSPGVFDDTFQDNNGIWVTCLTTAVFVAGYRVNLGEKAGKVFAWMSGGCFEGYLLSRLLDVWVYGLVPQWHRPDRYILAILFVTVPVFLISVLAGKATHSVTNGIMGLLKKKKR